MRAVAFPGGETVGALGQGTWRLGERPERRAQEIAALREGVELGLSVIDTAEAYANGVSETLVGEALQGLRGQVFLVSKTRPERARDSLDRACERSLRRLGTDHIDLYLLDGRGSAPLDETVRALEALRDAGKIRHWGVSGLGRGEMEELLACGGAGCGASQMAYNLARRNAELDLLPWLARRRIPAIARSPIDQGRLLRSRALTGIAKRMGVHPVQAALAWLLQRDAMILIPKAGSVAHVREVRAAADLRLNEAALALIEAAFPPPHHPCKLEVL
ncbi:MAG: aldo/keto reductase [Candidatus Accumulibacter sp.]|nr:aldo/keto reductase [Accumulibacter sp.]